MGYLLVKRVKDGFSMMKLSYISKKGRTLGFFVMLFPLYAIYGFIIFDYILRSFFGKMVQYSATGIIIILIISAAVIANSYWANFRHYYDFFLDRKNKKIVFSRGNIKKEYNVEDITTLKVKFNLLMGMGTQFYLLINNDKFILRPGNLFIKNRWDSILNQDKLAHKHADRIKNIIGIKEI
jgi:hypothetical protein